MLEAEVPAKREKIVKCIEDQMARMSMGEK